MGVIDFFHLKFCSISKSIIGPVLVGESGDPGHKGVVGVARTKGTHFAS